MALLQKAPGGDQGWQGLMADPFVLLLQLFAVAGTPDEDGPIHHRLGPQFLHVELLEPGGILQVCYLFLCSFWPVRCAALPMHPLCSMFAKHGHIMHSEVYPVLLYPPILDAFCISAGLFFGGSTIGSD